ncbi:RNA methyltransferase [Microbacterium esteraromaticum]|uniref:TrmH family RNA methyltransferase n=1 Tax=Microbacterium esteraromaticum TaxID=57043 RepID=UPI001CD8000B|nr:RNA methyltransferase [Microbacterium esteraromaticum]MCA1306244.1 RNA methyltransferase [Microbacterium esteraromaticum]
MRLLPVTDAHDHVLDDYRSLTDAALRRVQEPAGGLYIAESAKVIERALAAGHVPRSVLTQQRWLDDVAALLDGRDVPVYVVSDAVAHELTGFAVHRGVMAAMRRPELPALTTVLDNARRVLVLEDIADPTNIGAAFRAAAGLGADAVLVTPRCGDPLYRRSVRVSMGTVFQVPWTRIGEWADAAHQLRAHGFEIAALALRDDAVPLDDYAASRPDRIALVMGTEGEGLSADALAVADRVVTIPMAGGVDSLNVASAAAVAVWAITR